MTRIKVLGVSVAFAGCAFVSLYDDGSESGGGGGGGHVVSHSTKLIGNAIFFFQVICCGAFFVSARCTRSRSCALSPP
jgi:hypothetical protein